MHIRLRLLSTSVALLLVILFSACSRNAISSNFEPSDFIQDGLSLVLAFDLRNDEKPLAGLVVNRSSINTTISHSVLLTFPSFEPKSDLTLAGATGHYRNFTVVSFVPSGAGVGAVTFVPLFSTPPPQNYDLSQLKGALYLLRSGLQRDFIYRYPDDFLMESLNPANLRSFAQDQFDAIAVAVPTNSQGVEIMSGQTAVPGHLSENTVTRFYPGKPPTPDIKTLHIRYEVPANKPQKDLANSLLSFISAIFVPLSGLLLMSPGDIKRPSTRRVFIVIAGIIQVCIIGWLGTSIWRAYESLDMPFFIQVGIVCFGTFLTGVVLWVKR
jgi:hypothetical protein